MTEAAIAKLEHWDYFISRSTRDAGIAKWIGKLIAAQNKSFVEQSEHFGHEHFMEAMHKAFLSGARVVALYSQSYLESEYCRREVYEALSGDPNNSLKRLIPLRIEPCAPQGMLNITYTDLLAERRQADASALAIKICRALGLGEPDLDKLPPMPEGLLTTPPRVIHASVRPVRSDLAPRPELMEQIAVALKRSGGNSRHMVAAVAGMGGAGKSVLARSFAIEHQNAYHAVWWVDAERRDATHSNMMADLAALGSLFSTEIKSEAQSNVAQAARRTLSLIESAGQERPFLLIYDNVEHPRDITNWTPRSGAHIIVTTRYAEWDDIVAKVDVGMLAPGVAVEFLLRRGKKKLDDPQERAAAATLANELGHLPLALDHAASYCAGGRRVSFSEYLGLYLQKLSHEPDGASESSRHRSVRATFALALERAIGGDAVLGVKACPEAGIVMGVAALLAPVPIPFALFSHPWLSSADLDAAWRALAEVSLIAVEPDAFTVHRVIQAIMRDRMAEVGETAKELQLTTELLATKFQVSAGKVDATGLEKLAAHAEIALRYNKSITRRTWMLTDEYGCWLLRSGNVRGAIQHLEAAQKLANSLRLTINDETQSLHDLSVSQENLARALREDERLGEAMAIVNALCNTRELLYSKFPNSKQFQRDLASALEHLADLKRATFLRNRQDASFWRDAMSLYQQSLTLTQDLAAGDPPEDESLHDLSVSIDRIGDMFVILEQFQRGIQEYQKSLAIRSQLTINSESNLEWLRSEAVSHHKIGDACIASGEPKVALASLASALEIGLILRRRDAGRIQWRFDLIMYYSSIAAAQFKLGNEQAAREALSQAVLELDLIESDIGCVPKSRALREQIDRLG